MTTHARDHRLHQDGYARTATAATVLYWAERSRAGRSAARVARTLAARLGSGLVLTGPVVQRHEAAAPADCSDNLMCTAIEEDAELLVVPRPVASSLPDEACSRLAALAPCPVVIAPERLRRPWPPTGGLICAVDGSEDGLVAACLAADLASRLGSSLLLADWPSNDGAGHAEEARELLDQVLLAPPATVDVGVAPLPGDLPELCARQGAELLVVASLEDPRPATVPVLVVPPIAHVGEGSGHYELRSRATWRL